MKKLFSLLLMMVLAMPMFAGKVKVTSGGTSWLKGQETVNIEFDFSNTTWEKDENFKTWCGEDYEKRVDAIENGFIKSFNDNSKGAKLSNAENSQYKMIVVVKDLERHQAFTGMWGQGKFSTTCLIKVVNTTTNDIVCEISVDGYGSGKDFNYTDGIRKCYQALGKEIAKLK